MGVIRNPYNRNYKSSLSPHPQSLLTLIANCIIAITKSITTIIAKIVNTM
nr:MAG TPA: hypothetical protein [Caudoviricetes sp.]